MDTLYDRANDRSNLGVILDPEVKFKLSPSKIPEAHSKVLDSFRKDWRDKPVLRIVELQELHEAVKEHNKNNQEKVYLHEMMEGGELLIPKLEIPKRNPELEKRVEALRNSLAEKEYQKMTKNVSSASRYKPEDSVAYEMKRMNTGLIAVLQFVITLACAFFFGFVGIELFIGNLQLAVRLGLGIGSALIVGAAELYFLAINLDMGEEEPKSSHTNQRKPFLAQQPESEPALNDPTRGSTRSSSSVESKKTL